MQRRAALVLGGVLGVLGPGLVFAQASSARRWDAQADVVVIGSGAAGLCAAIEAAGQHRSVLLLERNAHLGGDTLLAGGYFNAVDEKRQRAQGILGDSPELFFEQILESGGGKNSPELARVLACGATDALDWLEGLGVRFLPRVSLIYGGLYPRSHKPVLDRGKEYIRVLSERALRLKVRIRRETTARELVVTQHGEICGVVAESAGKELRIRALRGVVLASGSFGAGRELLRRFAPETADLPTDSNPGNTGLMLSAAEAAGASLINLSEVECVPGAAPGFKNPLRLDYDQTRMIMVNERGESFVDELATRRVIARAVFRQKGLCWSVADSETVARLDPMTQKFLYQGLYSGRAFRADTPEELAGMIGLPAGRFARTFRSMAAARSLSRPPFWAVPIHMHVHVTLGGLQVDAQARCLDRQGRVMPRLYAAGGAIGNVHGANRIGGNGINTAVVFGRIAGRNAAVEPVLEAEGATE